MRKTKWGKCFDGKVWFLERGIDYECDDRTMGRRLRRFAERRRLSVKVRIETCKGLVRVEARPT